MGRIMSHRNRVTTGDLVWALILWATAMAVVWWVASTIMGWFS